MPLDCGACGANAQSRSLAFQYLPGGVARALVPKGLPPVYVAATGNDYSSSGFNYPAAYDSAVAIGSVTQARWTDPGSAIMDKRIRNIFL
jgi:hypothetical protein